MLKKLIAAATMLASASASANLVTFDILEAVWQNPVNGNITFIDPVAPATDELARVRWGGNTADPVLLSSGYDLITRPTAFTEQAGDTFALASFTHLNRPIPLGTSITEIELRLTADLIFENLMGDIFNYNAVNFLFEFMHDETPNGANPCAYDENDGLAVPGTGVNANGCADRVTVKSSSNSFVSPDGLTLNLLGFSDGIDNAEAGIFEDAFVSGEGSLNNVILAANFDVRSDVPAPTPLALLALGAGLLLVGRRVAAHAK